MKLVADQKRRVVLPKPAQPGDVFECVEVGDRYVLVRHVPKPIGPPCVSDQPLPEEAVDGVDLDRPIFAPLDE